MRSIVKKPWCSMQSTRSIFKIPNGTSPLENLSERQYSKPWPRLEVNKLLATGPQNKYVRRKFHGVDFSFSQKNVSTPRA